MNFKDKKQYETIKQYIIRKQIEECERRKDNTTFLGILILLAFFFIGLAK